MENLKPINITLIGRSGCGKGTQTELLIKHFGNIFVIATGDLMRDLAKQDTDTGARIRKILNEGGLPFDDLATTLWMHKIAYNVKENQGIIFDGAPRRLEEAKNIDKFLEFLERGDNTFNILIDVSREEAFNRLSNRKICNKCGKVFPWIDEFKTMEKCDQCTGKLIKRPDDVPEAINNRLNYYEEKVVEVVDYYKSKNTLIIINGGQPIEKVFQDILDAIGQRQK